MNETSEYKVYIGKPAPLLGQPIVIVTASHLINSGFHTEYFMLFSDNQEVFRCKRFIFKIDKNIPFTFKIDFDFLIDFAKDAAETKIREVIRKTYDETKDVWYWEYNAELKEKNEEFLIGLYFREGQSENLKKIRGFSNARTLKDFLEKFLDCEIEYYTE